MKKILIASLIVLTAVIITGVYLYQQRHMFYPKVTFSIVHIRQIEAADAEMLVRVQLNNRAPFSLQFNHLNFQVKADDRVLLETMGKIPLHLKKRSVSDFEVPVKIHLEDIKKVVKTEEGDSTLYTFEAQLIDPGFAFLPDTVKISSSDNLPTYKLPKVTMTSLEKDELLAKGGPTFFLHLLIENRNRFPLEVQNPTYAVFLQEKELLFDGEYSKILVVDPLTSKAVKLQVQFDRDILLKNSGKLLFNKDELDLRIVFNGKLLTRNPYIDGCDITILIKGSLKEFLNKGS